MAVCHEDMSSPFPPPGGGPKLVDHHSKQPAWKRIHRSPFFWIATACIAVAMYIFVTSLNLTVAP